MARNGISALRLTVSRIDAEGNEERRGGRYDLDFDEQGVDELTNVQIADIFANMAANTVLYELGEYEPRALAMLEQAAVNL